jgi:hypothetical protein
MQTETFGGKNVGYYKKLITQLTPYNQMGRQQFKRRQLYQYMKKTLQK